LPVYTSEQIPGIWLILGAEEDFKNVTVALGAGVRALLRTEQTPALVFL
jgi:hypothetical protein